jgi:hypothetical protein
MSKIGPKFETEVQGWVTSERVAALTQAATDRFRYEPAVFDVRGDFRIVGDLDGDIHTLVDILLREGYGESTKYVFLGNYIGSGEFSVHVLLLLYALKILFPAGVLILRGTREFETEAQSIGFEARLDAFGLDRIALFGAFMQSWDLMPLAAIVNGQYFCVHGGIFPGIRNRQDVMDQLLKPSPDQKSLALDFLWGTFDKLVDEYEWNEEGSPGRKVGEMVATRFLKACHLTAIIRSGEKLTDGFEWTLEMKPKGGVLTIYSAVGREDGSSGAVAVVREHETAVRIEVYRPVNVSYANQ